MTPQKHPITPPRELIMDWCKQWTCINEPGPIHGWIATQAARWGADQELEACCSIAERSAVCGTKHQRRTLVALIKERRRPKPPSLKEQSLALIDKIQSNKEMWQTDDLDIVRQALESLPS